MLYLRAFGTLAELGAQLTNLLDLGRLDLHKEAERSPGVYLGRKRSGRL
jgi:hypothetical protein